MIVGNFFANLFGLTLITILLDPTMGGVSTRAWMIMFAFFTLQSIQQRWLTPFFFSQGKIHRVKGAIRIRISTRLTAMLFACNIVPLCGLLYLLHHMAPPGVNPEQPVMGMIPALTVDIVIFVVMGIWVTFLVTRNFTQPLRRLTRALKAIRAGDLGQTVRVTTNDEIGYSGEVDIYTVPFS